MFPIYRRYPLNEKILVAYCTVEIPPGDYNETFRAHFAPDDNGNPRVFNDEETARLYIAVYGPILGHPLENFILVKINGDRLVLPNGATFKR